MNKKIEEANKRWAERKDKKPVEKDHFWRNGLNLERERKRKQK